MLIHGDTLSHEDRDRLFEPHCSTPGCPYPAAELGQCWRCEMMERNARDYERKLGFKLYQPES